MKKCLIAMRAYVFFRLIFVFLAKILQMYFFRLTILVIIFGTSSCESALKMEQKEIVQKRDASKIRGMSFVASAKPFDSTELEILAGTHAQHLSLMPFGFMETLTSSSIAFDHPWQWWGERSDGCAESIRQCKQKGFQIMLKPQIWVGSGDFTGRIEMNKEEDWLKLEESYARFILHFAKIASDERVEVFCIGTEMEKFVAKRPAFWQKLVQDVRKIYKGKLTYAENWDCFDKPLFLDQLDYVGVDAYFPLSAEKDPTEAEIRIGWKPHVEKMKLCANQTGLPILFTECGYRSIDFAGSKPWDFGKNDSAVNQKLQSKLLKVMFELWEEDWMAGGYIWKWFPYHVKAGGPKDDQFTPQNKLAENTIRTFYKLYSTSGQ